MAVEIMNFTKTTEVAEVESPPQPIDPVKPVPDAQMDGATLRLRRTEWQRYLVRRRHGAGIAADSSQEPEDLAGISLSGGGIRSATFALGILQALAKHDLLKCFDYLSTVSGGGYIGASLTWLTSQKALDGAGQAAPNPVHRKLPQDGFGVDPAGGRRPFPYGTDDPGDPIPTAPSSAESAMLRYLVRRREGARPVPGEDRAAVQAIFGDGPWRLPHGPAPLRDCSEVGSPRFQ